MMAKVNGVGILAGGGSTSSRKDTAVELNVENGKWSEIGNMPHGYTKAAYGVVKASASIILTLSYRKRNIQYFCIAQDQFSMIKTANKLADFH